MPLVRIQKLIQSLDDDKSMKALLKNGVLILDYLCTDLWMSSAAKIVLIEWLKKDCIPKPHFILLRYTMNRICDRVYKPSGPLSASWLDADHPGHRTELIAQMSVGDEDITMFRNRSFETDTLLRRPVNGLVEDLLDEIKDATVFDRDSMLITYGKLILAYEHATAIRGGRILFIFIVPGASIPIQHNDQEHDEHLAYLKTFRWRLLSDKDCHCEDNIPPKNDPHFEFHKCFGPESQHDQDFGAGLQHAAKVAAASWTRLKQWKVLGQSIRTGSERIRERTIPEHIKERVIDMVPEGTSIDDIWA